ncbi:MAG: hypothetical protein AW09_001112 [Candidatus Accumulibacter phosphatis]|uniref:Uncharacterized protein n=1 Tax=Candidatus Accumulibacter phosphatis TaxID=327160 RepID=A0A080LXW3_9PROT|nr:MAG: hypothetical protein AW09_001112 [Candidatus Accumulibacter phosphatis]
MVAAAGAVGVEVDAFDSLLGEPLPGRRVLAERTGRRDMVGSDRVAEDQQRPRAANVAGKLRWQFEERRAGDVGRWWPVVDLAGRRRNGFPEILVGADVGVTPAEGLGIERERQHGVDLLRARPDLAQIDRLAVGTATQRFAVEVDIGPAGDCKSHDQRRRSEVIGAQIGMDARFEVAVTREHRGGDELVIGNRLVERRVEVAGIADTGRAAVTGEREAEFGERLQEASLFQIIGDHPRAGSQRGLDVRLHAQAFVDGLLRQQSGGDHHCRIAGIGA